MRWFQSCFDVMTTHTQLFPQTINKTEECSSETLPWTKKLHWTGSWLPVCTGVDGMLFFFFHFLLYPVKTKCFYVLCKWFLHVVWQFIFAIFFFLKKKIPEEETNKQKPTTKQNTEGWHYIWKNIWIENLPEDVDRFFFFNRKSDAKRWAKQKWKQIVFLSN